MSEQYRIKTIRNLLNVVFLTIIKTHQFSSEYKVWTFNKKLRWWAFGTPNFLPELKFINCSTVYIRTVCH